MRWFLRVHCVPWGFRHVLSEDCDVHAQTCTERTSGPIGRSSIRARTSPLASVSTCTFDALAGGPVCPPWQALCSRVLQPHLIIFEPLSCLCALAEARTRRVDKLHLLPPHAPCQRLALLPPPAPLPIRVEGAAAGCPSHYSISLSFGLCSRQSPASSTLARASCWCRRSGCGMTKWVRYNLGAAWIQGHASRRRTTSLARCNSTRRAQQWAWTTIRTRWAFASGSCCTESTSLPSAPSTASPPTF